MIPRRFHTLFINLGLVLGATVTMTPLVWMLSASLMSPGEANSIPPHFLPVTPTLENYHVLFTRLNIARSLLNSTFITTMATVISLFVNSMAGYAFAKLSFKGRDPLFRSLISALVIPAQVGMLPLFLALREMGLVNSYMGVLIPYMANIFGIFLIRQYMLSVPDDLLDAARIDGAGEFRIFWTIVVPIIRPVIVTLATFTFLNTWNDFMWPLIVLSDNSKFTLPVALASLAGEHVQDTELMMAGSVVAILPALIVFLLFQRTYVRSILSGSLKG